MKRKGYGIGKGMGYKNMMPMDSHIHSLSAKGVKTYTYTIKSNIPINKNWLGMTIERQMAIDDNTDVNKFSEMSKKYKEYDITVSAKAKKLKAMGGSEPFETFKKGRKRAEIYVDESPESPREWDNMGKMVAFHKKYELGDKTELNSDMFNSWGDLQKYLFETKKAVVVLPLYLYDHSGLRMKVGDFKGLLPQGHYEFDSGQVGYIYTTADNIKEFYGVDKITDKIRKSAEKTLKQEVDTFDQYLSGDVYGYKIIEEKPVTVTKKYPDGKTTTEKKKEEQEINSIWGFYGLENAEAEAKAELGLKK